MQQRNVLGGELMPCSFDPLTGYYRTGCCENRGDDPGMHVVCCQVTAEFLEFSVSRGNDLVTPMPQHGFPGLRPGDQWCVCAARWAEALEAGAACPVVLESTHMSALEYVDLEDLRAYAVMWTPSSSRHWAGYAVCTCSGVIRNVASGTESTRARTAP